MLYLPTRQQQNVLLYFGPINQRGPRHMVRSSRRHGRHLLRPRKVRRPEHNLDSQGPVNSLAPQAPPVKASPGPAPHPWLQRTRPARITQLVGGNTRNRRGPPCRVDERPSFSPHVVPAPHLRRSRCRRSHLQGSHSPFTRQPQRSPSECNGLRARSGVHGDAA